MTLEGLSSVCAKSEPASSKNNEILQINVLQKIEETFGKIEIIGEHLKYAFNSHA